MPPLDAEHLTPAASLNRVRLADLSGLSLDPGILGQTAYQLVSSAALTDLIRQHSADLGLNPTADDQTLRRTFEACFDSETLSIRAAAEQVARQYGQRLGGVVLVLKRGEAANRAARPEWDDSYWTHWASIQQIWFGGGLANGRFGAAMLPYVAAVLLEGGVTDCAVQISPYAGVLPLVGAARCVPPDTDAALVCDFGGTRFKRAQAVYQHGELTGLRHIKIEYPALTPYEDSASWAAQLLGHMVRFMLEGVQEIGSCSFIAASLAAYMQNGQPIPGQGGGYYALARLTDNVEAMLAELMSTKVGRPVSVIAPHDGTAAAAAYAGQPHTAVIMLGTALGVGFAPLTRSVRPLCPEFGELSESP